MATHQPQDAVVPEHTRYPTTTTTKIAHEKLPLLNEAELPEPSTSSHRPQPHPKMMASLRGLLVVLTCLLVTFSLTLALTDDPLPGRHDGSNRKAVQPSSDDSPSTDPSTLQSLLDAVSPESLHELLHQYFPDRFQHGVWPSDRAAVEAVVVHPEDGPAVTSLVRMLRRDNTTTTTTSSTSEQPAPSSTTPTPLPTTMPSSTPTQGPTSSSSTAGSPSSSSSPGSTTTSNTSSRPPTSTTRRPQTNTFTSFVNGSPTIVVQTTYVDAVDGPAESTIAASLQTNAAVAPGRGNRGMVDAAFAGGVVVGGVLFA